VRDRLRKRQSRTNEIEDAVAALRPAAVAGAALERVTRSDLRGARLPIGRVRRLRGRADGAASASSAACRPWSYRSTACARWKPPLARLGLRLHAPDHAVVTSWRSCLLRSHARYAPTV